MSCDDGVVMTLHPASGQPHGPTAARFGPDTGHDIPIRVEFTDALAPARAVRDVPRLPTSSSTPSARRCGRASWLAGRLYPSVYVGSPWWFLDPPEAIRRFRSAVMETAGFSRTAGFVDDTRAFCSIPSRHDASRRVDAGVLAQLVAEHRLDEHEAVEMAVDLVTASRRSIANEPGVGHVRVAGLLRAISRDPPARLDPPGRLRQRHARAGRDRRGHRPVRRGHAQPLLRLVRQHR